jgi:acyl transferase domain-containing protein
MTQFQGASAPKAMPIAIIGMSCRFPGDATTPERLWEMCAQAKDGWSPIPKSRFNLDGFHDSESSQHGTVWSTALSSPSKAIIVLKG